MLKRLHNKWPLLVTLLIGLIASPLISRAAINKPGIKQTTTVKKKSSRTKAKKKTPYILAPKTEGLVIPEEPHTHNFSPEFIQILADGNLDRAYRSLQLEEASDKVGYMINEVTLAQGKSMSHDHNTDLLSQAMANHNIYLFLQRNGRTVPRYAKAAEKYYKKLLRKDVYKNRANILLAALAANQNNTALSQRYFDKVDVLTLIQDGHSYSGLEYVALYYASQRDVQMALKYLYLAYQANPGLVLQWLHVGDDFWMIEDDPYFEKTVADWKAEHQKKLAQMQRDKKTHAAQKKAALKKSSKKKRKAKRK